MTLGAEVWKIGELIGEGGAGRVYAATDPAGQRAAAKFVIGGNTSKREFEFSKLSNATHVMPILATGAHQGNLVILMPRAETSLRPILEQHPNGMPLDEAVPILRDIATGLAQLADAGVVHRDIKPENILHYDGRWVISDFGIARHSDLGTSLHTHKHRFTTHYAAPEQWDSQRSSHKTDIYAFGITAVELLTGRRPFSDLDDYEDLAHAHRNEPVRFTGNPPLLYSLIEQCLLKPPDARPSAATVLADLDKLDNPAANLPGIQNIVAVHQEFRRQRDSFEQRRVDEEHDRKRFDELLKHAEQQWIRISDEFVETISAGIPVEYAGATRYGKGQWVLQLNMAKLEFSTCFGAQRHPSPSPYTLVAGAMVTLSIPRMGGNYTGRAHSLWYGDLVNEGELGWYEIAFAASPGSKRPLTEPFDVRPSWVAGDIFAGISEHYQVAWPPTLWRLGNLTEHINRWAEWFAAAANGTLRRPQIPELPLDGTWRRPPS